MTMHTDIPQPPSLPTINLLHLMVSEILPRQDFIGQGHYGKGQGQTKMLYNYNSQPMSLSIINFPHLMFSNI